MRFMRESRRESCSLTELGEIVATDAGLSAQLLRYLNSGSFGLRRRVDSVTRAVTLMGLSATQSFLIAAAMQDAAEQSLVRYAGRTLFHPGTFSRTNLQRGLFARELAILLGIDSETTFAAALMQDVLLPVLCDRHTDEYARLIDAGDGRPLVAREQVEFGWTHPAASAILMRDWWLPPEIVGCVRLHHRLDLVDADPLLRDSPAYPVALSALLPDGYSQSIDGIGQLLDRTAPMPDVDLAPLARTVDRLIEPLLPRAVRRVSLAAAVEKRLRERKAEQKADQKADQKAKQRAARSP